MKISSLLAAPWSPLRASWPAGTHSNSGTCPFEGPRVDRDVDAYSGGDPGTQCCDHSVTNQLEDAGAAHSGLDADAGDPNTRAHTGVHTQGDLATWRPPDPGTVDSDFQPAPTECLGSSQSNRGCGDTGTADHTGREEW